MSTRLLQTHQLVRHYQLPREKPWGPVPRVHALNGVDVQIVPGRSLGIVGESGSGKSTLARVVMALEPPTSGSVTLLGRDLQTLSPARLREARRDFQMVFQDPYGSLDPRQRVARIVAEPLSALGKTTRVEQREQAAEVLASVGLRTTDLDKYPHEFSGGQRQRIAIARALITRPRLIVADEPVSALDVSVQAQVLNLMQDLQAQYGITYMLISHDLAVVDHLCEEVAVIYLGRIVEQGPPDLLFRFAAHPYTQALLDAVPRAEPGRRRTAARVSGSLIAVPMAGNATGCAYAARCPHARQRCMQEAPALRPVQDGHLAACHFAEEIAGLRATANHR
ncbi:MAG: ATP-binding cassette domain-containing protein [Bdellovibrionales bacterium]|nr:ATP-binding cassette domain-containing protein [Ramlibacter sp.]